jgi:hypothetical protein
MTGRGRRLARRGLAAVVVAVGLVLGSAVATAAAPVVDNTRVHYDVHGQRLDAHDGDLVQGPDGSIYYFGTSYGCGFQLNAPSAYCGVRVYQTRDLATWTPAGGVGGQYAFNHLDSSWQDACAPPASFGCFNPHVARRSDGRYVMWINVDGVGHGSQTEASYRVLVADSPSTPFVATATPPRLAVDPGDGWLEHGAADITVDPWGVGWISYTVIREDPPAGEASHVVVVERLDSTLTTGTGQYVVVTAANRGTTPVEMPSLFRAPNGTWHLTYSDPAVPYGIGGTSVLDAPHPLGPWTNPRTLQGDSCSGQHAGVAQLGTVRVLITDRWVQPATGPNTGVVPNQTKAVPYFGLLTFTATDPVTGRTGVIDAHRCQATWTLPTAALTPVRATR